MARRPHRFVGLAGRFFMGGSAIGLVFVALACLAASDGTDVVYIVFAVFFLVMAAAGLRVALRGQPWQ
jgi:hypothetical protein